MYIFRILVQIVAEYLLALLVNSVNVVDYNELFLVRNVGRRLAKRFHFGAEELDALFFQIVYKHDVVFGESRGFIESIVFANDCVDKRCFSGTCVSHQKNIQIVQFMKRFEYIDMRLVQVEICDKVGAIFQNKCWGFFLH